MPPTHLYADFLITDRSHSYDVTTLSDVSTEIGKGDGRIKSFRNDSQTTSKQTFLPEWHFSHPGARAGAKGETIMNNDQRAITSPTLCVVTYSGQWVRLGVQGKWPRRARVQPARVRPPFQESDHAYRVEQKTLLSSVTHILSGLMGRALAALG